MDISHYIGMLKRRKWIVVAAAVVAAVTAFAMSYTQTPVYRASATLAVPSTPSAADVIAGSGGRSSDEAQEMAQLQLLRLKSRLLAEVVLQRLKLPMTTDALLGMVAAESDPNAPSAFTITVSDGDGQRAATIANAYADGLVALDASENARDLTKAIEEIDRKLNAYDKKIAALSARMDAAQARALVTARARDGAPPASTAVGTQVYAQWVKTTDAYNALSQKKDDLLVARAAIGTPIRVIERAAAPNGPMSENPFAKGTVGLLVGLMLGVGGVFVMEYSENALKTNDEIAKYFQSPVLGELARRDVDARSELVMKTRPTSAAAEAYRVLRTNLVFESRQQSARSLLVAELFSSGAAPVVANLAASLAQAGFRVLLVCSNRRSASAACLGLDGKEGKGLSDWLVNGGSVNDFIVDANVDGLHVIPPGSPVQNPTELLTCEAMARLPKDLANGYHFILLEAPPVLETADASVLAQDVDAVVLVAGQDRLNASAATQARDRLNGVKARLLGVVVVKAA